MFFAQTCIREIFVHHYDNVGVDENQNEMIDSYTAFIGW